MASTAPSAAPGPSPDGSPIESVATSESASQIASQYEILTSGCGLVDRSHRGRLALTGPDAVEFLNGQVTNDLARLGPGEGCYAAFLNHKGKMLGDLRVLAVDGGLVNGGATDGGAANDGAADGGTGDGGGELLLETERVALQSLFDMIRRFKIGYKVELHKRTLETAVLSLIGPTARAVALSTVEADDPAAGEGALPGEGEHFHRAATIAGAPVRLIATAEPAGIDVLCDAPALQAVQAALIAAGAQPVSEDAAEILRVEHGRPRYGIDLDENVIPQEARLNERAVSFTKGCYLGQETVARLHYKGKPNRHLEGLTLSEPVPAGAELTFEGRAAGTLTSSVLSPRLGPIGLALLRKEAQPGATVTAGSAAGQITALPFTR